MFDLVIRNGTVLDGSGAPRRIADVAVQDGKIAAVGPKLGAGRREIDAAGLLVTPGFVDIHTHYDGQATWDPFVTPSSWHGVTTTIFGNCGVGFAPVRPGQSSYLINLMEGVEDIPGTVLSDGVKFNWESFPDYLDALESMNRAVVSPMVQYRATDGQVNDYHIVHPGKFALGKFGIVFTENCAIVPEGRVTQGDLGMWHDSQI